MIETLFKLLMGFAVADLALQPTEMAKGKNRHYKPDYIPQGQKVVAVWPFFMTGHTLIHAGAVLLVTNNIWLALAELVLHWMIDFAKCENWTNPYTDQALHFLCRVGYVVVI